MDNLRENYRRNICGSLMGAFVLAVAGYQATYLKALGGTDYHFAMLSAMPAMVAVLALIPGAMIIDSTKNKLKTTLAICFATRFFFLLYAFVPLVPREIQPLVFVLLVGLRNAPESVWLIGYQSLMPDVFPMDTLNEIVGKRTRYNNILTIGATFILGLFLSLNEKFPISNIFLFQALFVFTFAVGIWEICQYRRFKFEAKPVLETESFGKKLLGVIKTLPEHPDYVRYCLTAIVFYLRSEERRAGKEC